MEDRRGTPHECRDAAVVSHECPDRQLLVIGMDDDVSVHEPRGGFEPDPLRATIGDRPPADVRWRASEAETESRSPEQLATEAGGILQRGASPFLGRGLDPPRDLCGENIDVIGVSHAGEGPDHAGNVRLLNEGRHRYHRPRLSTRPVELSALTVCSKYSKHKPMTEDKLTKRASAVFVEGMGAAFAGSGVLSQLQGRIFGLLYLEPDSLSLGDIA